MQAKEQEDIQALINIFFPFAEELLVKFGDFHPYAGATTVAGEYVSVGQLNKQEHSDSKLAIAGLKQSLQKASKDYLVAAVFYEVRTRDSETDQITDAIAVFVEHRDGDSAYEFFYAYKIENKEQFTVEDTYGNMVARQVFV